MSHRRVVTVLSFASLVLASAAPPSAALSSAVPSSVAVASDPVAADCTRVALGQGVTLAEATPIAAILDAPEAFVGREVVVDGVVADVCQAAGCWLELRAAEGGRTIKVKVEDGEIVFPKDSRGLGARAQGKVERMDLDREGYILHREHEAHEQGTDFDSSNVPAEGPWYVYRIRGTGAELCR